MTHNHTTHELKIISNNKHFLEINRIEKIYLIVQSAKLVFSMDKQS